MKRNLLKSAFFAALCTVFTLGVMVVSTPTDAKSLSNCPTLACPADLTGWEVDLTGWFLGRCKTYLGHGCYTLCKVYRNTSTGESCKSTMCAYE